VRSDEVYKEIVAMKNCGRCHTCGEELVQVPWPVGQDGLDGEAWCSACQTYRHYRSHGWGEAGEADAGFECPEQIQPLKPSEPDYGRWLEELMGIEWCRQAFPEGYYDDTLPQPAPPATVSPTCPTCGRVVGVIGVIEVPTEVCSGAPGSPPRATPGSSGNLIWPTAHNTRSRLTRSLRRLRLDIEREMAEDGLEPCLADAQAAMLIDVCRALGLKDTETRYVLGPAGRNLL
jgi:hypothetical protein